MKITLELKDGARFVSYDADNVKITEGFVIIFDTANGYKRSIAWPVKRVLSIHTEELIIH